MAEIIPLIKNFRIPDLFSKAAIVSKQINTFFFLTDHATPAVVLYDFVLALQAIGWILISRVAAKAKLAKSEKAEKEIRKTASLDILLLLFMHFVPF
ncbi:MAG: hypothetical protein KGM16_03850 [Bacteroidota bacterium]|nr:hypothetical protein [Bacteroidota bacterium]